MTVMRAARKAAEVEYNALMEAHKRGDEFGMSRALAGLGAIALGQR